MLDRKRFSPRAKDNMHRVFLYLGLVMTTSLVSAASGAADNTKCAPPTILQNKLREHASAKIYSQLANWYGDKKQYSCAIEAVHAGLKAEPRSAELFYLLGLNLLRKGDFAKSVEPLEKSVELNPDLIKPHLLLASALEDLNRTMEARKEWLAAIKIDPHSEMALDGASKNLLTTSDYQSIVELLGDQPLDETLTVDLAAAYEGYGSLDQASEILEKALQEKPSSSRLTKALINLSISQSHFVKADELARKLIQQNPHDVETQVLYLRALLLNDEDDQARPLAQKLLVAIPHNFTVLYLNGILENRSGNYAAARGHLEEAIKLNPNHYNSRFTFGITLSHLGDLPGAREQFEKALSLGAPDPQVHFEYAKVLRALGETTLAAEQLQLYQEKQKESADHTAAAIKTGQADKELASGDPKKAVGLYREAVSANPTNAILNFKLSVALDRVGDRAGEMEALKKAIQLDPEMAVAHYQLGYLASLSGDFLTAEDQYDQATKAAPRYVEAWIGLAAMLGTESRFSEAKQAIENALKIDPKNANAIELQKELDSGAAQANR